MKNPRLWALGALIVTTLSLSSAFRANAPHIEAVADDGGFTVTFEPGAVWACTVFQQQVIGTPDQNFPDGRYTPRKCNELVDPQMTSFTENWDYIKRYNTDWHVWAEIGYLVEGVEPHYIATNVAEVHR